VCKLAGEKGGGKEKCCSHCGAFSVGKSKGFAGLFGRKRWWRTARGGVEGSRFLEGKHLKEKREKHWLCCGAAQKVSSESGEGEKGSLNRKARNVGECEGKQGWRRKEGEFRRTVDRGMPN